MCANPAAMATAVNTMLRTKNVFVAMRSSTLCRAGLRERAGYRDWLTVRQGYELSRRPVLHNAPGELLSEAEATQERTLEAASSTGLLGSQCHV
jgi:hypothetical protein